jgi:hypothetical protein
MSLIRTADVEETNRTWIRSVEFLEVPPGGIGILGSPGIIGAGGPLGEGVVEGAVGSIAGADELGSGGTVTGTGIDWTGGVGMEGDCWDGMNRGGSAVLLPEDDGNDPGVAFTGGGMVVAGTVTVGADALPFVALPFAALPFAGGGGFFGPKMRENNPGFLGGSCVESVVEAEFDEADFLAPLAGGVFSGTLSGAVLGGKSGSLGRGLAFG